MTVTELALSLSSSGSSRKGLQGRAWPLRHQGHRAVETETPAGRVRWGVLLPGRRGDPGAHPQLRPEGLCPCPRPAHVSALGHMYDHTCACAQNAHNT